MASILCFLTPSCLPLPLTSLPCKDGLYNPSHEPEGVFPSLTYFRQTFVVGKLPEKRAKRWQMGVANTGGNNGGHNGGGDVHIFPTGLSPP